MEMSIIGSRYFSWPAAQAMPAPRRWMRPVPPSAARLLTVLALYAVTVFAIHGLGSAFSSHPAVTTSDTGMCHRH